MKHRPSMLVTVASFAFASTLWAQDEPSEEMTEEESTLGWESAIDLSYVAAFGNSDTETLGFRSLLRYRWPEARYTLRFDGLHSNNADEKFVQILTPSDPEADIVIEDLIVLVEPEKSLDAEKYLIENIYDRALSDRLYWNLGFSWDRNKDANILNRYVGFFGLGHLWWDREALRFETTYGLSYTKRVEERPDPDKDAEFPGLRLGSSFRKQWGSVTTLGNDWTSNVSLSDPGDWNFDTSTHLMVSMNRFVGIKVSLRWLYNSRPALQDIDVLAILPQGVELSFGEIRFPKENLDTIFSTAISFHF